jgi:uncharacterized protein (TIGR02453 family)
MGMATSNAPRFSTQTIAFLKKASRQKNPNWLDRNREEYETVLLNPLNHLAQILSSELALLAPDYHFPKKGLGRIKRPANRVAERGGGLYKDWMTYSAARPRTSRFEHNPNLFFLINSDDDKDPVLVAGGLYMPSSKQTRALRETIANDATAFDQLFKTKEFSKRFPEGFSTERTSSRPPRGFDVNHPRMNWLKLQAFFVWRPYTKKEFASKDFASIVAQDWKQILKLNRLLEKALQGQLRSEPPSKKRASSSLLDKLEEIGPIKRQMDF